MAPTQPLMTNDLVSRSVPPVIFVHGVSLDPRLFDATARLLRHRSEAWSRPGYDGTSPAHSFEEQVERLVEHLTRAEPRVVVGVSGGATLGLAAAIAKPTAMAGLITHEPLIGPLEPDLDERIATASVSLGRDASSDAINSFLRRLYGDTWDRRPDDSVKWSDKHMHQIPADVEQFAAFAPALEDLMSIRTQHTTTVGSRSLPERHRVAEILSAAGACTTVIPDSGHLVLTDNPARFAATIDRVADSVADRCAP